MNNFEKASKLKLRFNTHFGLISVEDLWDLSLINNTENLSSLNNIAKDINKALKELNEENFVNPTTTTNSILELKLNIIKHIIEVKINEKETVVKSAETKAKKEQIVALIADKQNDSLASKSEEELKELLDYLTE